MAEVRILDKLRCCSWIRFIIAFEWPRSESWTNFVVALGYGSLYNHSNTPNANWTNDVENKTFIFFSTKPIKKGEEIFIYYGDENYWSDGRTHVEVK